MRRNRVGVNSWRRLWRHCAQRLLTAGLGCWSAVCQLRSELKRAGGRALSHGSRTPASKVLEVARSNSNSARTFLNFKTLTCFLSEIYGSFIFSFVADNTPHGVKFRPASWNGRLADRPHTDPGARSFHTGLPGTVRFRAGQGHHQGGSSAKDKRLLVLPQPDNWQPPA